MLGIKHPIIQGAMGGISNDPEFVAAVCNAGALGVVAAHFLSPEGTREVIRRVRELTDKPFGINIMPDCIEHDRLLEVMCEEKVPVFTYGRGNPVKSIKAANSIGALAIPTVGAVKHAVRAEQDGADAVTVVGTEGGGHSSYVGTMVLVPAVLRAVKIPVIAGGGIAIPEQFAAALALGAEGIEMGTRFEVTKETRIHPNIKQKLIEATEEDTSLSYQLTGRQTRGLLNRFRMRISEDVAEERVTERRTIDWTTRWRYAASFLLGGDAEEAPVEAGQSVGLIDDIPTVAELIERMVEGAGRTLDGLYRRYRAAA